MTTESTAKNRAIYGRGYRDGLQAAQVQTAKEEHAMMNQARFNSVYNGLTSIAKKVYEAVPISEPWDTKKIVSEIHRCGTNPDPSIIAGCLNSLIAAGLVHEPSAKMFVRVAVKQKPVREAATSQEPPYQHQATNETAPTVTTKPTAAKPTAKAPDTIEKMSALAARVNQMMVQLKELASDIETTALEIEEQMAEREKDMGKLRQLQALLRDLSPAT